MGREDEAIGLHPSYTGVVGGKETGQRRWTTSFPMVPFATFGKLAATRWKLNLQPPCTGGQKTASSKIKVTCPACGQNAWGKPDLAITCTPCGLDMLAERVITNAPLHHTVEIPCNASR